MEQYKEQNYPRIVYLNGLEHLPPCSYYAVSSLCQSESFVKHHNIKCKTYRNLPSWAAAPPVIILVMKILESSPMCGLSVPPAMLKPSPEFP